MNIRRKGTSAINEVHQKLLILQEENDRLRQTVLSVKDVEKLMAENRQMKFELQKFKPLTPERYPNELGKLNSLLFNIS